MRLMSHRNVEYYLSRYFSNLRLAASSAFKYLALDTSLPPYFEHQVQIRRLSILQQHQISAITNPDDCGFKTIIIDCSQKRLCFLVHLYAHDS
ncbi:hypothetical protein AO398_10625 [Methylobacterium sp. GXS13]|nr:hypothetical protein AO398_10625 [Methylobacterium sp. GXS13]